MNNGIRMMIWTWNFAHTSPDPSRFLHPPIPLSPWSKVGPTKNSAFGIKCVTALSDQCLTPNLNYAYRGWNENLPGDQRIQTMFQTCRDHGHNEFQQMITNDIRWNADGPLTLGGFDLTCYWLSDHFLSFFLIFFMVIFYIYFFYFNFIRL